MIRNYILKRENLMNLFVLIDGRHNPMEADLEFINFLGTNMVPFSVVFTKTDKPKNKELKLVLEQYDKALMKTWEELPPRFVSSAINKSGRDEILDYIEKTLTYFEKPELS